MQRQWSSSLKWWFVHAIVWVKQYVENRWHMLACINVLRFAGTVIVFESQWWKSIRDKCRINSHDAIEGNGSEGQLLFRC